MTVKFKPLLAFTIEDTSTLAYPLYTSVKLDGIRAVVLGGVVYSRSMKPIRSKLVQRLFGKQEYNGFDGELLYGDFNAKDVFNVTTQVVMATELKDHFNENLLSFVVFDDVSHEGNYFSRVNNYFERLEESPHSRIFALKHQKICSESDLLKFENWSLEQGYEGIMVRSIDGPYKQGRSTDKEGICGKLKRFSDAEAIILGFEEKMTNTNVAKTNELGRTQRSQAQEGMVGANTLGALVCECNGIHFTMGSGMDDAMRNEVWNNKDKYLGKLAKFKYFEVGMKDSYRFPVFLGWRDIEDTSNG